jgi:hypothetical protein
MLFEKSVTEDMKQLLATAFLWTLASWVVSGLLYGKLFGTSDGHRKWKVEINNSNTANNTYKWYSVQNTHREHKHCSNGAIIDY